MPAAGREQIVPTRFDDEAIEHDLAFLPRAATLALQALRRDIDKAGGLPLSHLKGCQSEGRDGTSLAGCVKTYVPWPDGRYGLVFNAVEHSTRPWGLRAIAFGVRHHPRGSNARTVYQLAHERLHSTAAPSQIP
jgi:hypothetical protein